MMTEFHVSEEELNKLFGYLIGLPIKEAILIVGSSMSIRAIIKEGKDIPSDNFYKENRLNVEIKNKQIYRIISIG